MAISYVNGATGTNTATMPAHQVGDTLVVFAYRDNNVTPPTLPTGWTNIVNGGGSTNSMRVAYKVAASTSETTGTWTNATSVAVLVYRGCDQTDPIGGASGITTGNGTTATWPAGTLQVASGTSWIVGAVGGSNGFAPYGAPASLTGRLLTSDSTDTLRACDSNAGVTSWSSTTSTNTTGGNWAGCTIELLEEIPTAPALSNATVTPVSATSGIPRVTTNKSDGTAYMVVVADGDTPSVAQIKAGQNSSGGAAINAQSQTVTASGIQAFSTVTGLTTDTPYDVWFVHTNSIGDSAAVKADYTPRVISNMTLFWAFP